MAKGLNLQIVTSAFRTFPIEWASYPRLNVSVSIDGLQPEHDARRAPATYERILKNIEGRKVTIHSTITSQTSSPGYLEDFLKFWTPRPEIKAVWFSIFTPQRGERLPEILTPQQRADVIQELMVLRRKYPKLDMAPELIEQFAKPPQSPKDCIFAQTTATISADFQTMITPCQFGGNPDCSQCGCIASMGLAAIADHKLGGLLRVKPIFDASIWVGKRRSGATVPAVKPVFDILKT
jgi:sulfatase maturation enzyme AslB (radical SAM superfamily)